MELVEELHSKTSTALLASTLCFISRTEFVWITEGDEQASYVLKHEIKLVNSELDWNWKLGSTTEQI